MDKERLEKWKAEQREKQRAFAKEQRARMKADPRVQAMKQAQKDRASAYRKQAAADRKRQKQERVDGEPAERTAALLQLVRPSRDV